MQIAGPTPRVSQANGLGWDLRVCIFGRFQVMGMLLDQQPLLRTIVPEQELADGNK